MKNRVLLGRTLSFAALITAAIAGHAVIVWDFGVVVTGATPNGPPPWARLTIEDDGADTVKFTIEHLPSSAPGQFLSELFLNMDPFPVDPALVESSPKITNGTFGEDAINRAGGNFDVSIEFETDNSGGGVNRIKPGDAPEVFRITGTGLNENAFLAESQGDLNVPALLHIQGIVGGVGSGHVTVVPEPASLLALVTALGLLAARRRAK